MPDDLSPFFVQLLKLGLATPRTLVVFSLMPIFSAQTLGTSPRMAVAAAMALPLLPVVGQGLPPDLALSTGTFAVLLLKEVAVGLVLGLLLAVPFWAAEAVGFIIDNQRGAAMAVQVNPMTQNESSPFGVLLYMAMVVCFFEGGGAEAMLGVTYESYLLWPVGQAFPEWHTETPLRLLGVLDRLMYLGVVLAGPMALAMLMSELSLAIISLFAPQLQVFPLAMGVKSGVALLVLFLYAALLVDFLSGEFGAAAQVLARVQGMLR